MTIVKNAFLSKIHGLLHGMEAKIRANAVEYHLKQSAQHHPLALKEGQPSEVIRFLQSGLTALGYDAGPSDGVFSPAFIRAINDYIPKKKSEAVDITEYVEGGHKALAAVSSLRDISANHIAAIADSLSDAGKMRFDQPDTLKQYCAALKEIPDETIAAIVRDMEAEIRKSV